MIRAAALPAGTLSGERHNVSGQTREQAVHEMWRLELEKGLAQLRTGAFATARRHFARAYRAAPSEPTVCYAYGRELIRDSELVRGEELLRFAWANDRTLVGAAATLARSLGLEHRRLEEAHALLDEAEAVGGDPGVVLVVRAELYLEEGRAGEAREAAARALELDDGDYVGLGANAAIARAENLEGVELADAGELDGALFRFRRASLADPEWVAPRINAAVVFERLGRLGAALRSAEEAIAADPEHPGARVEHSRLLLALGRGEEAAANLAEATREAPDRGELVCALAEIHLELGDEAGASKTLVEYLRGQLGAADVQAWFLLARAQLGEGDHDMAEDCLRQVIEMDPDHGDARCLLADLLARQGRYLEAAAQAERASDLDTDRALECFWGSAGPRPAGPKYSR